MSVDSSARRPSTLSALSVEIPSEELHVAALQAWYLREALNLVYDWSTRSMKRALATYCCCENASRIVSDQISMRCGILTLRQGNFGQNRQIPTGLQDHFVLTNSFRHPVTTSSASSLTFRNWRGTGHI